MKIVLGIFIGIASLLILSTIYFTVQEYKLEAGR